MSKNISREEFRLIKEEENKTIVLRNAIKDGLDSGIANDFDPNKHLEFLKAKKHTDV